MLQKFTNTPWVVVKPVIWGDRNRDAYYINNLTDSHRFEVYIDTLFAQNGVDLGLYYGRDEQYNQGENRLGIEIKRDKKSSEGSPNLFIEYQERLNPRSQEWVNSGILRDDNTRFYLIGDIDNFWVFNKEDLVYIYNQLYRGNSYYNGCRLVKVVRGTSRGYIIPKDYANQIAISFEELLQQI